MAARGMLVKRAEVSSWAKVMPPFSFSASMPMAPSVPLPERMMPMALEPWSRASDSSKSSTGIGGPIVWLRSLSCRRPCSTDMLVLGGVT